MAQAQLVKATVTVLDGADKGKVIAVLFNPTEYSFDRSNAFKSTPVPGLGAPLLQFVNGEADHLSMDLFLDDYTDPKGPTSNAKSEREPVKTRLRDFAIVTCTRRRRCVSTGGRSSSPPSSRSSGASSPSSIPTAPRRARRCRSASRNTARCASNSRIRGANRPTRPSGGRP